MTPENLFDPRTEPFVALCEYTIGTTSYGYGPDRATAEKEADRLSAHGAEIRETRVYERTEETKKRGKYLWQVYRRLS